MNYPISVRIVELESAPFRSAKAADAYARSHGITGRMSVLDTDVCRAAASPTGRRQP